MKKMKPAVIKELSLKEYILVFKHFMNKSGRKHASGFVNIPLLYEKPSEDKLQELIRLAIKHGTLVQDGQATDINPVIYTFVNAWTQSPHVVMLRKESFGEGRAIAFARVEGFYLAVVQDAGRDHIMLLADPDAGILYDFLKKEIENRDGAGKFKVKNANKMFRDQDRELCLEVEPINRIFLQCVNNTEGGKAGADVLLHVGKKQLEAIRLDNCQKIETVEKKDTSCLRDYILQYIEKNCPVETNADHTHRDRGGLGTGDNDPEYYTGLSFKKLTGNAQFPKGFWGFLKMVSANLVRCVFHWKFLLKRIGMVLILSGLAMVWNLYALCYLNDTFNIGRRAVFGKATAYLLAGVANTDTIPGLPFFAKSFHTVTLTVLLYYLLSIAVTTLIRDITSGKVRTNLRHFISFGSQIKLYMSAVSKEAEWYFYIGIAFAAICNVVILNPFAVFLLAVLLLFSCMKCEDGGITPFLMIFSSCVRYKGVVSGRRKPPMFGAFQLRLLGLAVGLLICSVSNAILWLWMDFEFWLRVAVSVLIILFVLMRLGIIRIHRPAAKTGVFLGILTLQTIILVAMPWLYAMADDGGWSESGRSLSGLMKNSGWPTILTFSLTLAGAVAVGCLTLGLGTAVVLGASAVTFGVSAAAATFTETGRVAAYDFVWGNYSPYGGHSKVATALNIFVSVVPVYGDAFGMITGVRDCSYDIREGDWAALALDGIGFVMDVHGLAGDVGDVLKHADDIADAARVGVRNLDDVGIAAASSDVAAIAGRHADDVAESVARHADDAVEAVGRHADDAVEAVGRHADDADPIVARHADKADEVADGIWNNLSGRSSLEDFRKANEEVANAIHELGREAGYSDEALDRYVEIISSNKQYDISKTAWGDGWNALTDEERQIVQEIASGEKYFQEGLLESRLNGLNTLMEYADRYDSGVFDAGKYELDDILKLRLNVDSVAAKDYSSIVHGDLLPRADEFVSDQAVVDYVKSLCPDNVNLSRCNTLQEVADELYANPVNLEFVTFQDARIDAANILKFDGNYGNISVSMQDGGGIFAVPVSQLENYAKNYSDLCSYEDGVFRILNQEQFGNKVLSGVPLSSAEGAYMIRTTVPFNGVNISMPSVKNSGAYMDQFVSGGRLLSGEIETTIKPLRDIISDSVSSGDDLVGVRDGIEYVISILK